MSVIILAKQSKHEYETTKLIEKFEEKEIVAKVCYFEKIDIIINDGIYYDGEKLELPKAILVRVGAGIGRKDLSVVRYFELSNIPCFNSSDSINIVQDKFHSGEILSKAGIAVPTTIIVKHPITNDLVNEHIGFPCIIKVVVGSFGEGVHLCNTTEDYRRFVDFVNIVYNTKVLIAQEYIGERPGEDLRVLVIGGKVLGAMKRTAPDGDFRANITNGGTGESFEITPEIAEIAVNAANILKLDIAGIDLLFDSRGFRVCEANSNPGFSGFEKYCNTDVAGAIVSFIESKLN